jgi:hypothetical protein
METFPTGDTIFFSSGLHMRDESMVFYLEDIRPRHIEAGLDASKTHDTSIKPLLDQRGSIGDGRKLPFLGRKFILLNSEFISSILELTFASCIADRAVQRMVDQQEFQSLKPHFFDAFRPSVDDHPLGHRGRTGGHGHFRTLDIDQTNAAGFEQA